MISLYHNALHLHANNNCICHIEALTLLVDVLQFSREMSRGHEVCTVCDDRGQVNGLRLSGGYVINPGYQSLIPTTPVLRHCGADPLLT